MNYFDREYDEWNKVKKNIQSGVDIPDFFPQEGEVWMSSLGKNIGFEQNGSGTSFSRPIIIVKKFNNQMFWSAPLSTKQKKFDFYYNFTDPNEQEVSVILAQMKLVSVKRLKRDIYIMPTELFEEIKEKLKLFL